MQEAKLLIEEIPIASNINLIIADPLNAAYIEILDGHKSTITIDDENKLLLYQQTMQLVHQFRN